MAMGDSDRRIKVDNAVKEAIQCMISYNDSHDHLDQIFICPASVNKFFSDKEKVKSFNLEPRMFGKESRARVLKAFADIIDAHHKQHNLNSNHNLRTGNLKKRSKKNKVIGDSDKTKQIPKEKSMLDFRWSKLSEAEQQKEDEDLISDIKQDLQQKWKEYRELVQERKLKEAKSRKEPEVYHHFKK